MTAVHPGRGDEARELAPTRQKIRDEIEKTKGFIGTGGIVNMSPTDHLGLDLSAFRMLEIKDGDWSRCSVGKLTLSSGERARPGLVDGKRRSGPGRAFARPGG